MAAQAASGDTDINSAAKNITETSSKTSSLKTTNEDDLQAIDSGNFTEETTDEAVDEAQTDKKTTSNQNTKTDETKTTDKEGVSDEETKLDINDFKNFVENNKKIKKALGDTKYEDVFNSLDKNGDSKISADELEAISKGASAFDDITAGELKKYIKNMPTDEEDEGAFNKLLDKIKTALGLSDDNSQNVQAANDTGAAYGGGSSGGGSYGGGGYSGGGSSNVSGSSGTQNSTSATEDDSQSLDEQIKQLEEVDIPKSESDLEELSETKDKDTKEQQEIQEKAIEESDEVSQELKDEYEEVETALTEAQDGLSETESTKADKESELSEVTSNISELDAQIGAIDTNTDDEEKNAENQKIKDDLTAQKTKLEQEKDKLEKEIEELDGKIEEYEKTIEEQENLKEDVLERIKESLDPDSPLLKIIEETEEEIKNIETNYEKDSADLEKTLSSQRTELTELKEQRGKQEGESHNGGEFASFFDKCADFANGALAGMGDYIESVCEKYNIDPYLVASIMAQETGYGTSSAIKNQNNPGGYMDPSTGCSTIKTFGSLEEGIEAVVRNLSNNYTSQGLTTIKSIGQKYCPVGAANDPTGLNSGWIPGVTTIYNKLTGKNITYDTNLALT